MATVQDVKQSQAGRSDSLTRMLELEKLYKMQRIRDNGPAALGEVAQPSTSVAAPRRTQSPAAAAAATKGPSLSANNLSGGGKAPQSNPAQIGTMPVGPARRSTGLPSLSLSIPLQPPPVATPAAVTAAVTATVTAAAHEVESSDEEVTPTQSKQKTVTFSDPEDEAEDEDADNDGMSDQSSICHSPSWEGYGYSKSKAKKRETAQRRKEQIVQEKEREKAAEKEREKEKANGAKEPRKKPARLSKLPPTDATAPKPVQSERSISAPELKPQQKQSMIPKMDIKTALKMDPKTPPKTGRRVPPQVPSQMPPQISRSYSDLPPGSTAKQIDSQKQMPGGQSEKRKSKGFLSGFRSGGAAVQKLMSSSQTSLDKTQSSRAISPLPPPRKNSLTGTAPEKKDRPKGPPLTQSAVFAPTQRPPSRERRSSFGQKFKSHRNSSFLALLKGHGHSSDNDEPKRPESSDQAHATNERAVASPEQSPPPVAPASPTTVEPADTVLSSQRQTRRWNVDDATNEHKQANQAAPRSRQSLEPSLHTGKGVDIPTTKEGRHQSHSYVEQARQHNERAALLSASRTWDGEVEAKRHPRQHRRHEPHSSLETGGRQNVTEAVEIAQPRPLRPAQTHGFVSVDRNEVDHLVLGYQTPREDDQASAHTHTSTIRPARGSGEAGVVRSISTSSIGKAITHDSAETPHAGGGLQPMPNNSYAEEVEPVNETRRSLKREQSTDYFASFMSPTYDPPCLALHSPAEDMFWTALPSPYEKQTSPYERQKEKSLAEPPGAPEANYPTKPWIQSKPQTSPALSAHQHDGDVPVFDGLGIIPRAPKAAAPGCDANPSSEYQTSSTSERSSSSVHDDAGAFPSPMTTPDTSRPQSRKEASQDVPKSPSHGPKSSVDDRGHRKLRRTSPMDTHVASASMPGKRDKRSPHENESRASRSADHDDHPSSKPPPTRAYGSSSTTSLPSQPRLASFVDAPGQDSEDGDLPMPRRVSMPPKAHSSTDLPATGFLPPLKHQPLHHTVKNKSKLSSVSLPATISGEESSSSSSPDTAVVSAGAAMYLQEARKAAPAAAASSRALRPVSRSAFPAAAAQAKGGNGVAPETTEPMAKMLVQCCSCKFYHDMPSRVYECMAKPDTVVEDRVLGVSAAITTMVKCPWCGHGMSTQCCAGYAALVFLKEKLHGR